jgi:hypothetical protein
MSWSWSKRETRPGLVGVPVTVTRTGELHVCSWWWADAVLVHVFCCTLYSLHCTAHACMLLVPCLYVASENPGGSSFVFHGLGSVHVPSSFLQPKKVCSVTYLWFCAYISLAVNFQSLDVCLCSLCFALNGHTHSHTIFNLIYMTHLHACILRVTYGGSIHSFWFL